MTEASTYPAAAINPLRVEMSGASPTLFVPITVVADNKSGTRIRKGGKPTYCQAAVLVGFERSIQLDGVRLIWVA
jgi:hypothetical protein